MKLNPTFYNTAVHVSVHVDIHVSVKPMLNFCRNDNFLYQYISFFPSEDSILGSYEGYEKAIAEVRQTLEKSIRMVRKNMEKQGTLVIGLLM